MRELDDNDELEDWEDEGDDWNEDDEDEDDDDDDWDDDTYFGWRDDEFDDDWDWDDEDDMWDDWWDRDAIFDDEGDWWDDDDDELWWEDFDIDEEDIDFGDGRIGVDPHILSTPTVGDIDNDGFDEVVVATSYFFDRDYYDQEEHKNVRFMPCNNYVCAEKSFG